jgi:hypothetical protein
MEISDDVSVRIAHHHANENQVDVDLEGREFVVGGDFLRGVAGCLGGSGS